LPLIRAELQRRRLPRPGPLLHDLSQVLYLPFDHDDGSYARDRSGYDNHGTIYGASLVAGKIGMARSFDGVDDYVKVPYDTTLDGFSALTLALWVYLRSYPQTWNHLIDKWWVATGAIFLGVRSDNKVQFALRNDAGVEGVVEDTVMTLHAWHNIIGTWDGSTMRLFFDGDEVGTPASLSGTLTRTADIVIGTNRVKAANWVDGVIDEPRILTRGVTKAEVPRLMYLRGI